jgi:hypothetical protein
MRKGLLLAFPPFADLDEGIAELNHIGPIDVAGVIEPHGAGGPALMWLRSSRSAEVTSEAGANIKAG